MKDHSFFRSYTGLFLAAVLTLILTGCHSKGKTALKDLPLPPTVDGGLVNGQYIQVDYGFGIPLPTKWIYLPVSAEQEVDEVARFMDPGKEMLVRLSVLLKDPSQKFNAKIWVDQAEDDLKNHQFQIEKKETVEEWKTDSDENWIMAAFKMTDARNNEWADEECALAKDDYLIVAHMTLPQATAETDHGKKLFLAMKDSLSRITWYMPVGARGISSSRYELQHFTEQFCRALESKSVVRVGGFFDEMYPDKSKWNAWYQQTVAGDPKSFDLQAQLTGLVINGDGATASFVLVRKDKAKDSKPVKLERDFKLAKKDDQWKITLSLDKD